MIKKEFVENNLLKVLNYLPKYVENNNHNIFYLTIEKTYNNMWTIRYLYDDYVSLYIVIQFEDLIDAIIYTIEQLDKYIPDFINNLINI